MLWSGTHITSPRYTQDFWIRNRLEPDPDPIGPESSWCDQGLIPDPPGTRARPSDPWEAVSNITNDKYNKDLRENCPSGHLLPGGRLFFWGNLSYWSIICLWSFIQEVRVGVIWEGSSFMKWPMKRKWGACRGDLGLCPFESPWPTEHLTKFPLCRDVAHFTP